MLPPKYRNRWRSCSSAAINRAASRSRVASARRRDTGSGDCEESFKEYGPAVSLSSSQETVWPPAALVNFAPLREDTPAPAAAPLWNLTRPSAANPADLCGNQSSRHVRAESLTSSTPSTRRLLDGVAMPIPHRSTEPARHTHWLISTQRPTHRVRRPRVAQRDPRDASLQDGRYIQTVLRSFESSARALFRTVLQEHVRLVRPA